MAVLPAYATNPLSPVYGTSTHSKVVRFGDLGELPSPQLGLILVISGRSDIPNRMEVGRFFTVSSPATMIC